MLKKLAVLVAFLLFVGAYPVWAAEGEFSPNLSFQSTMSAETEATISALVQVRERDDLTESVKSKSRLEQVLDSQVVKSVWPFNFLKVGIRRAVEGGVAANTLVLLLLFPLTAALVAFSRNVVGVKGFGIFTPAVVAVAFLATGVAAGLILFGLIILAASLGRIGIRKLARLPYMPRMALIIWLVSLVVLILLLISPGLGLLPLMSLGIFPILLFVLLAETFIDAQIHRSMRSAVAMTVETLILALIAFFVMSAFWLQEMVLLNPEVTVTGIFLVNILIGRYSGLRLLEVWRFRELLKS